MSTIISMENIRKTYDVGDHHVDALKGINITVKEGDLLSIVGASGSGKSTLMNIMGLLDSPDCGSYILDNHNVSQLTGDDRAFIRNKTIGFVFQSFFLLPRLSAVQNVALPLLYRGVHHKERYETAMSMLEKVLMGDYANHRPNELSGGQQQRVAVARALVGNPSILLADEPTGALDSKISQEVMELFKSLNNNDGVTTIIITHDPTVAAQCKRVVTIQDGDILSNVVNK